MRCRTILWSVKFKLKCRRVHHLQVGGIANVTIGGKNLSSANMLRRKLGHFNTNAGIHKRYCPSQRSAMDRFMRELPNAKKLVKELIDQIVAGNSLAFFKLMASGLPAHLQLIRRGRKDRGVFQFSRLGQEAMPNRRAGYGCARHFEDRLRPLPPQRQVLLAKSSIQFHPLLSVL